LHQRKYTKIEKTVKKNTVPNKLGENSKIEDQFKYFYRIFVEAIVAI